MPHEMNASQLSAVPFCSLFSFVGGKDKEPRCLQVKQNGSEKMGSPVPSGPRPVPPRLSCARGRVLPWGSAVVPSPDPRPALSLNGFSGNLFSL